MLTGMRVGVILYHTSVQCAATCCNKLKTCQCSILLLDSLAGSPTSKSATNSNAAMAFNSCSKHDGENTFVNMADSCSRFSQLYRGLRNVANLLPPSTTTQSHAACYVVGSLYARAKSHFKIKKHICTTQFVLHRCFSRTPAIACLHNTEVIALLHRMCNTSTL